MVTRHISFLLPLPHFSKIVFVTFLPHCTHHILSLDVAVMAPFKENVLLHKMYR